MSGNQSHVDWIVASTQLIRAIAWPTVAFIAICWFKREIGEFLKAVSTLMSQRTIEASFGNASIHLGATAEKMREAQQEVEPAPQPATKPVEDVIEARRFILRDDAGRARGDLALAGKEGHRFPSFRLFDSSGKPAVTLTAYDNDLVYMAVGNKYPLKIYADKEEPLILLGPNEKKMLTIIQPNGIAVSDLKTGVSLTLPEEQKPSSGRS